LSPAVRSVPHTMHLVATSPTRVPHTGHSLGLLGEESEGNAIMRDYTKLFNRKDES
jgi:hypothetical protein